MYRSAYELFKYYATVDPVHMSGITKIEIKNRKCNWPWILKLLFFYFVFVSLFFFAIESIFLAFVIVIWFLLLYYAKAHMPYGPYTEIRCWHSYQSTVWFNQMICVFIIQICIQFLNLVVGGIEMLNQKLLSPLYAIASM